MCNCKDVKLGSYSNQSSLGKPSWATKEIYVDNCLANEIYTLWHLGVHTVGCCCGHNKVIPMINVIPEHHNKMIELGYEYWFNEFGTYCYKPKTV